MEEIVVPHRGTVGMEWFALLPAVLVQAEIQKIFIWEDGKREIDGFTTADCTTDTRMVNRKWKIIY